MPPVVGMQIKRRNGGGDLIDALKIQDIAAGRTDNADPLGAVDRASAPNGDDAIASRLPVEACAICHLLGPRVGIHVGKDVVVDLVFLEARGHVLCPAGGNDATIGDEKGARETPRFLA